MKNKQMQSTVKSSTVDKARPAKVATINEEESAEIYFLQGYFRAYISFVLKKSNDEQEIADSFNELLCVSDEDKTNIILGFFKLSLQDELITFDHIDKLMLAMINTDQDSDIIGWLSESFEFMKNELAL